MGDFFLGKAVKGGAARNYRKQFKSRHFNEPVHCSSWIKIVPALEFNVCHIFCRFRQPKHAFKISTSEIEVKSKNLRTHLINREGCAVLWRAAGKARRRSIAAALCD